MPDVVDQDICRVTTVMSFGTSDIQNTYHVKYAGTDITDANFKLEVATYFNTLFDQYNAFVSDVITYDYIDFFNVTQDRPMGQEPWPSLTVGASIDDVDALQNAPLILFNTEVNKSQGRKYMPPPGSSSCNNGGQLQSSIVAALTTFASLFDAPTVIGSGTGRYGNWNKLLGRFAPWVASQVITNVKTQRRRALGVGT